jgi:non-heme chloroperoxidase
MPSQVYERSARLPGGLALPYLEHGRRNGVPVLLLHGITDSCRAFEPALPDLPESLHALALSQRGHGDAGAAQGYRLEDFAADLASFMDVLALDEAVIVGHSMGAAVAQRFAIDHPERVLGLVLVGGSPAFGRNPDLVAFGETVVMSLTDPVDPTVARGFQESTLARPIAEPMLDVFVSESLKVPARVWKEAWAGLMAGDLTAELPYVAAPTLMIWGDRDTIATKADQDTLVGSIPGSRIVTFAGAGHALHWEEPARFAALVAEFALAAASGRDSAAQSAA